MENFGWDKIDSDLELCDVSVCAALYATDGVRCRMEAKTANKQFAMPDRRAQPTSIVSVFQNFSLSYCFQGMLQFEVFIYGCRFGRANSH